MKNLTTNGFAEDETKVLLGKARHIILQMTANVATFATPNPLLATVQHSVDELDAADQDAENGDHIKIAIRNERHVVLVGQLQQLGTYVNNVANGNRPVAMLSGFEVRKPNEPRVLEVITTAPRAARTATAGTVNAATTWQKAANKGAVWYITDDGTKPLSQWTRRDNEGVKVTFSNLVPGKEYIICVELLGPRKQRQMSPRATVIA